MANETRRLIAREAPGNVEAAATLYCADEGVEQGGSPVADVYDARAVPVLAAAPEMLEALHRADLHIRLLVNKGEYLMGTDAILDAIRAAIAKAEGR